MSLLLANSASLVARLSVTCLRVGAGISCLLEIARSIRAPTTIKPSPLAVDNPDVSRASDFEATWYPRIGEDAAKQLRRLGQVVWLWPLNVIETFGFALLIGRGPLADVIGWLLALGLVVNLGVFVRLQWNTAAAISLWFGVERMRWLPRMTPERFDLWKRLRGFMTPDEREAADREASAGHAEQSPV